MNPNIQFSVTGLSQISVHGDTYGFPVRQQEPLTSMTFLLSDDEITGIRADFSETAILDPELIAHTTRLVELYLNTIIGELSVTPYGFSVEVRSVYNPNLPVEEGPLRLSSSLTLTDAVSITSNYSIERYQQIFEDLPTSEKDIDHRIAFGAIMKIDNLAVRFLIQYELLLTLTTYHRRQKEVTDYIARTYNPSCHFGTIRMLPTRKENQHYLEDEISYYRNILAHNNGSDLPENWEDKVASMSKAANEVIFYAFHHPLPERHPEPPQAVSEDERPSES